MKQLLSIKLLAVVFISLLVTGSALAIFGSNEPDTQQHRSSVESESVTKSSHKTTINHESSTKDDDTNKSTEENRQLTTNTAGRGGYPVRLVQSAPVQSISNKPNNPQHNIATDQGQTELFDEDLLLAANAAAAQVYSVNHLVSDGTCGDYPIVWCDAPTDSLVDDWGMYNRESVSYAAFKVAASGRYMPYWGGYGNANQWISNAQAAGIPTGSEPQVGSVAVMNVGYYGHVMYVEAINDDGKIHVSQFNWGASGEYSTMDINLSGLTFIYF